jgi:hypothetical protein
LKNKDSLTPIELLPKEVQQQAQQQILEMISEDTVIRS